MCVCVEFPKKVIELCMHKNASGGKTARVLNFSFFGLFFFIFFRSKEGHFLLGRKDAVLKFFNSQM